jgi:hypothetical protein
MRRRKLRRPLAKLLHCAALIDPHSYPQTRRAAATARFNLRRSKAALSLMSGRSRLVLPNVTIAKVRLAWVR